LCPSFRNGYHIFGFSCHEQFTQPPGQTLSNAVERKNLIEIPELAAKRGQKDRPAAITRRGAIQLVKKPRRVCTRRRTDYARGRPQLSVEKGRRPFSTA
jgi:hypothetical protein